jgi:hypothetical protein
MYPVPGLFIQRLDSPKHHVVINGQKFYVAANQKTNKEILQILNTFSMPSDVLVDASSSGHR